MPAQSRRHLMTRIISLALVSLLTLTLVGCNQLSAKRNLSKLESILQEIMVHQRDPQSETPNALRFRIQQTQDLEQAINNIRDMVAREAYEQAAEQAKLQMQTAPTLLDNVILDHANRNLGDASEDIRIAQSNQGNDLNAELWNEILELRDRMNSANSEQDWQGVIDNGQEIRDKVVTLLLPIQNRASDMLAQARLRTQDFDDREVQARINDSDGVTSSLRAIEAVEDDINNRRYRSAISNAEAALTLISSTILNAKGVVAAQGIAELETLGNEIYEHGGVNSLPARFNRFSEDFDKLNGYNAVADFDQALTQIRVMRPIAQRLLIDTYQMEAEEFIDLRRDEIKNLEETEVRTYLPGMVEVAIELNAQASATFEEGLARAADIDGIPDSEFDTINDPKDTREQRLINEVRPIYIDAVDLATEAGEEVDKIDQAFQELAETHLADAQMELNEAVRLRDRLDQISDVRIEMAIEDLDRRFLENRETQIGEIETKLESAQIKKVTGELRLTMEAHPQYNVAIDLADEARSEAIAVQDEIYAIATRYSLIELAWMVDHYEREGAGVYVTNELDRTIRLMDDTREILANGDPREAISRVADARAQLEIMIQSLRRVANQEIQNLRTLKAETEGMLTEINAPERLELIDAQLTAAQAAADNSELKDAIESAQRGQRLAEATTTEAAREWAQTEIGDARAKIIHAEDAGASQYDAATLQDARDLLDGARRRFEAQDYLASQLAAAQASIKADESRLALISDAEEALVRARNYGVWDFDDEELVRAQVDVRQAIRYMDQGEYSDSRGDAVDAAMRIGDVTDRAKAALYADRIAGLKRTANYAINTGSNLFQPNELQDILDEVAQVERGYNIAEHDDYMRQVEGLETRMVLLIESTPALLDATLDGYRAQVRDLRDNQGADHYAYHELGAVAQHILAAEQSFEAGDYRSSYRNTVSAGRLLAGIQTQADQFAYKGKAEEVLDQLVLARYEFADYINVSPQMLIYMAIQPSGAGNATSLGSQSTSPTEFRRQVERLQTLALQIEPPSTRREHHEKLMACLRNAEMAARNFEYLQIADRMEEHTIRDTVESGYDFLETSHRQSMELTDALLESNLHGPVTMTEMGRPYLERAEARQGHGEYYTDNPRLWH